MRVRVRMYALHVKVYVRAFAGFRYVYARLCVRACLCNWDAFVGANGLSFAHVAFVSPWVCACACACVCAYDVGACACACVCLRAPALALSMLNGFARIFRSIVFPDGAAHLYV